jgi:hypothetical protein
MVMQTVVLFLQAAVLIWTAVLIRRYTKATETYTEEATLLRRETVRQNRIALRPIVLPEFGATRERLLFQVRNCGAGCAVNVVIEPISAGWQEIPTGNVASGEVVSRFDGVDYLPAGDCAEVPASEYVNGQRLDGGVYSYWFHPAKAVGPRIELNISFEDVEGRAYRICATIEEFASVEWRRFLREAGCHCASPSLFRSRRLRTSVRIIRNNVVAPRAISMLTHV